VISSAAAPHVRVLRAEFIIVFMAVTPSSSGIHPMQITLISVLYNYITT
jgi:hypothetical protein